MNYITQTHERNRRFTQAVRREMDRQRLQRATEAVINRVIHSPVEKGYFISVDHLIVMDRRRREGKLPKMADMTAEMWREIFAAFDSYMARNPQSTRTEAAIHVISRGRASRFFITRTLAKNILK
ncbi:MAG: hypothetical protein K2L05_07165 [Muribaculaceae bacterium]|nr:hypothetical protein [Muribaculaceae bacterium]